MTFRSFAKKIILSLSTIIIITLFTYQINSNMIKSTFFKDNYAQKKTETELEYFKKIKKTDKQIKHNKYTNIGVGILQVAPFIISITTLNSIMYTTYACSIMITAPVVAFGKKIFKEPRPDDKNDLTSFPSGHSAFAFMCATVLIMCMKNKKRYMLLNVLLIILASYSAIGRIIANRHWFIDVFCGSMIGIISSIIAFILIKKINNKLFIFK